MILMPAKRCCCEWRSLLGRAANLAGLVSDRAEAHFSLTILPFKAFGQFNVR